MNILNKIFFVPVLALSLTSLYAKGKPALNKSAVIVVTSHDKKGDSGQKTGWYLSEVTHIYYPLIEAGYKVDFASIQGGKAPLDESSLDLKDPLNKKFMEDKDLQKRMESTLAIDSIDPKLYSIVHFAGGHGAMWDFPDSAGVKKVAASIYESGGIVSAVCHGPAALVNVKLSNGQYLVKGKDVSAFTDAEEVEAGMAKTVPFLLEKTLRERGATLHPAKNWTDQSSISERLVTGQNPQSGHSVAIKILDLAKSLKK